MSSSPQRQEGGPAAVNHRHPFLQSRRQPHQHGAAASESALDVTAEERRERHLHHQGDVESVLAPPPASVAPSPGGDPAQPSQGGDSHADDDEVRWMR